MKGKHIAISLIVTFVIGLIYFFFNLPAINLQNPGFYGFVFILMAVYCVVRILLAGRKSQFNTVSGLKSFGRQLRSICLIPALIGVAMVAVCLLGGLFSSPLIHAGSYANILTLNTGDFAAEVQEVSFDQIPMLDKQSAERLGDRKLGELSDMVSQFEVSADYSQINYHGRPVRVTYLNYGDIIKWLNNRGEGLPAYIVIDMVTQNAEVVRLPSGMKYSPSEPLLRNLNRYLRFQYPTYIFGDPVFEVDEEGNPYWVCPRIVKTIGLFGGTDIDGVVLLNAVTGESRYYPIAEVPVWVDRAHSADLIVQQYNYYGTYHNGFFNSLFGQRDVTVTTEGYNYIAMNDDVYMYTGVTSVGSDESNIGFILANQRTKEATFYAVAGAEEYSAISSAEGLVQDLRYSATFPLLLNISGQPTYFMALKDGAGLVKMYAMVNVQYYQNAVTGATVAECEERYRSLLEQNGLIEAEETKTSTVSGELVEIRTAVIGGDSYYYLRLAEDTGYYVISAADCETAVILNVGDQVEITAGDTDGATAGDVRPAYSVTRR